jgi:chitinase
MRFKEGRNCDFAGIERAGIKSILAGPLRKRLDIILRFAAVSLFLFAFLPSICTAESVTLAWDENTEPDIAGYRVYYRIGSSGSYVMSLYDGTGIENGNSPIDIPVYEDENPDPRFVEIDLHGLDENLDYYFVVTAYNIEGYESAPSNEASLVGGVAGGDSPTPDASAESVGLGGSGGGCFISSVWP